MNDRVTISTEELQRLMDNVTPGDWINIGMQIHARKSGKEVKTWVATVKQGRADEIEAADARLIALAPSLARRVLAAEKLVEALRIAYDELLATVKGECPSLVNEDSGASDVLIGFMIDADAALREYEAAR